MITYKSICEKIGFDPILGNTDIYDNLPDYEDDSRISPYSVLTIKELDFVLECMREAKEIGKEVWLAEFAKYAQQE